MSKFKRKKSSNVKVGIKTLQWRRNPKFRLRSHILDEIQVISYKVIIM